MKIIKIKYVKYSRIFSIKIDSNTYDKSKKNLRRKTLIEK